jgi:hypothetical protein
LAAGAAHFLGAGAQHFFGAGAQQVLGAGAQQPSSFLSQLSRPASALFALMTQTIKAAVKLVHFIPVSPRTQPRDTRE